MDFRAMSVVAAGLCVALVVTLLVMPGLVFWLFGVGDDPVGGFMARRAAMLFLGLGIILWSCRLVPPGPAQSGICLGLCLSMGGLAVLGTAEWLRGAAGPGIMLAVLVETGLAVGFGRLRRG